MCVCVCVFGCWVVVGDERACAPQPRSSHVTTWAKLKTVFFREAYILALVSRFHEVKSPFIPYVLSFVQGQGQGQGIY